MLSHELIAGWFDDLVADLSREVDGMDPAPLAWHPDPDGNSIGITLWHVGRWLDVLKTRVLEGRDAREELWHRAGWSTRTGYDPSGIGSRGFGAITGYTWEEVEAVPKLSAEELIEYLSAAGEELAAHLRASGEEGLHGPASISGSDRTAYDWVRSVLWGGLGHLGEIRALKAMLARRAK